MGAVSGATPGEAERFEGLYRRHYGELVRFAARRVGIDSAREVVAEVFFVAWRRSAEIPGGSERAWLYGVARRVLANEVRSGERRLRLVERVQARTPSGSWTVPDPAQSIADGEEVRALLERLPAGAREVLELTEWDGLSITEAAEVIGCTAGALRVRLHRARRSLVGLYRSLEDTVIDEASEPSAPVPGRTPADTGSKT